MHNVEALNHMCSVPIAHSHKGSCKGVPFVVKAMVNCNHDYGTHDDIVLVKCQCSCFFPYKKKMKERDTRYASVIWLLFLIEHLYMICCVNNDRVSLQLKYQPPLTNNTKGRFTLRWRRPPVGQEFLAKTWLP